MEILLENNTFINESVLLEKQAKNFDNIFKKIDIYNRNVRLGIANESSKYNDRDIYFTLDEQVAVNDILLTIRTTLLERAYEECGLILDEGLWSKMKEIGSRAKNAVVNKVTNTLDKAKKLGEQFKATFELITQALSKGFKKVTELLKFFIQFFEKLGDNIKSAIQRLGIIGISDNEAEKECVDESLNRKVYSYLEYINEGKDTKDTKESKESKDKTPKKEIKIKDVDPSEIKFKDLDDKEIENSFHDKMEAEGEATFVDSVVAYVQARVKKNKDEFKGKNDLLTESELNEGLLSKLVDKVKNNSLFQAIANKDFLGALKITAKGVFGFLKQLFVSIVGSMACYTCIPIILDACAAFIPGLGWLFLFLKVAIKAFWFGKGIVRLFKNQYKKVKDSGGKEKFWSFGFFMQLAFQLLLLAAFQIPAVKNIMGSIINAIPGISQVSQAITNVMLEGTRGIVQGIGSLTSNAAETIANVTADAFLANGCGEWYRKNVDPNAYSKEVTKEVKLSDKEAAERTKKLGDTMQTEGKEAAQAYIKEHPGTNGGCANVPTNNIVNNEEYQKAIKTAAENIKVINVQDAGASMPQLVYNDGTPVTDPEILSKVNAISKSFCDSGAFGAATSVHDYDGTFLEFLGGPATEIVNVPIDIPADSLMFSWMPNKFKERDCEIVVTQGSNTTNKHGDASKLSLFKEMTFADLKSKSDNTDAISTLETKIKNNTKTAKSSFETAKKNKPGLLKKINLNKKIRKISNVDERPVYAIMSSDDNKPIIAFSFDTCECVDCKKENKSRKGTYPLKGLFSHIDINPAKEDDNKAKNDIYKMLFSILQKSIATIVNDFGGLGIEKENDKYIVSKEKEKTANAELKNFGNFTLTEMCEILNADENSKENIYYKYFTGKTGKQTGSETIENKRDYVKKNIIPIITNKDTDVYKEISNNEDLKKWLFKDGKLNVEKLNTPPVVELLHRTMETFQKSTELSWKEALGFDKKGKDLKGENANIRLLCETIWKYKKNREKWNKQCKLAGVQISKEKEKPAQKENTELSSKDAINFKNGLIKRLTLDEDSSEGKKKFANAIKKKCPLFFDGDKPNEKLINTQAIGGTLNMLFKSGWKNNNTNERINSIIEKQMERYVKEEDRKEYTKNLKNAYDIIKLAKNTEDPKYKKENSWRHIKESFVLNYNSFVKLLD